MTAAVARLELTPSRLMALKDLLLAYVVSHDRTRSFLDVVNQVETTPEELLELVAQLEPTLPAERPANTVTSVELDSYLERQHAADAERRAFEGQLPREAGDLPGLDLSPVCHPARPMFAVYKGGVIVLRCGLCGSPVTNVLVGAV
jgi:hypothetical protein